MVGSIHAEYAERINEIRPGVSARVGNAQEESDRGRSSSGNLEAVIISLNVGYSWEIVDAR